MVLLTLYLQKVNHYQTVVNNFWELAKVVAPGSKAILTCRTEHFRYSQESRDILSARVKASTSNIVLEPSHFMVAYIEKLNDEQIKEIIIKRREKGIGKETAENIAKKKVKGYRPNKGGLFLL